MSTIKGAIIKTWGTTPTYTSLPTPPPPSTGEVQIRVIAAGIHRLVRGRTTGKHFSATKLPHIPGSDGVGRTTHDNKLVYFTTFWEKGSFADIVNVAERDVIPLPEDLDPVQVAGLVNPALSSWMSIRARTRDLPQDFSVLIVGATTTSGMVAASVARILGSGKVFGAARRMEGLENAGYDGLIQLKENPEETDYSSVAEVDLVLDYIYGPAIVHLFKALKPMRAVQYVQVGTLASTSVDLPGDLLRAKDITMRGSAPGSYSMEVLAQEMPKMLASLKDVPKQKFKVVELKDIETEWVDEKSRIVVKIGSA
jgi:NADPH:quinone reductase-like Zn-dependent oxidoreductase